jgi:hypothetical protein
MMDSIRKRSLVHGGGARLGAVDSFALNEVGHLDAVRHRPAHVVFHQLMVLATRFKKGRNEFIGAELEHDISSSYCGREEGPLSL